MNWVEHLVIDQYLQMLERELNNTLNDRLNRSEFMPFAPIIADSLAVKCLESFDLDDPTYNFMTATVSVTDMFNEKCPAAVHIDKTARPQIVSSTQNQFIHSLLTYMYEHYGDLSLVNTSYNLHEEPIVCTPSDAFKALKSNAVDYLSIDNYLVFGRYVVDLIDQI